MAEKETKSGDVREKIVYIYRCPKCGKFSEEKCRNDALMCSDGTQMKLAQPEETIKHYKKSRMRYNLLTILFTIILPIIVLCLFMFVAEEPKDTQMSYKIPIIAVILVGAVVLKGRRVLERTITNTENTAIRVIMTFITKNILYIVLIAIFSIILATLDKIKGSLENILWALSIVTVLNTIGYCIFDYRYRTADYYIQRAARQSETLQALQMNNN